MVSSRPSKKRKQILETAIWVVLLALVVVWRLNRSPVPATGSSSPAAMAQPRLPTTKVWLGSQELIAEVAQTQAQIATGLMFRTNLAPNQAMLFVFAAPWKAAFYMKNTIIPLSCAYIDKKGVILELHDMQPRNETPIDARGTNIQFVLEVNQGWFETNHISPGTLVRTESGTLQDLARNLAGR